MGELKVLETARYKILLIEDDVIDQMAFMKVVKEENLSYDCTMADTISQAKSLLNNQEFDVVIADYMLKDGTAFDILDSVRDSPIIFATGAGNEKLAVKAMKAGAYDYLIKNTERSYLAVLPLIVENAVSHVKMEKEVRKYHENLEALVKERTEQLEEEKELLSVTFSSMTDGVIAVNTDKRIVLLNNVAEILTEVMLEKVRDKPVDEIVRLIDERSRDTVENPVDKVLSSGNVQSKTQPYILIGKNNLEHLVSVSASPIRKPHASVGGAVLLIHDLSQEREIDRIKTDFVSSVSHELRTPLTSIKAYTETILRDCRMQAQTQHNFLLAIDEESNRLMDLVNGILEIAQLESGSIELVKQNLDIADVIHQTVSSLTRLADSKNIQIFMDIEDELPRLWGNKNKIRSMVSNLVNNAIKFTPQGGNVTVSARHQSGELVICVSDTGIGIAREEIPKIFDRFYRVHLPGKQIPGTGLGLAIVKEIALLHGGKVEVDSEPGRGTALRVILPLNNLPESKTISKKYFAGMG
jgi:two-component system phosphate regulon sensor histidine kinase PhoR